jgi:uncharacterized protein YyaL (SSP411 family)
MTNESGLLFDKENDIDSVLKERGEQYGDFKSPSVLSQMLKAHTTIEYLSPELEYVQEAMDMICHKQARIVNGNPAHIDSWRDIAYPAMPVVKDLEKGDCDD